MSHPIDPTCVSDAEIISRCSSSSLLSDPTCSNKVVHIFSNIVVKFGPYVKKEEFWNQTIAFQRLDPAIVRVPAPHRFIQEGGIGYLVMDFVKGEEPNSTQAVAMAPQLGRILSHLHGIHNEKPGSLCGYAIQGVLWPDANVVFKDREDLENWLTRRLRGLRPRIEFGDQPLVMCHLDFVPRNMLVFDGTVTLLDWASSGYLPRMFDYIAHKFTSHDDLFFENLRPHLQPLTPQEEETARCVLEALENCIRFYLYVLQGDELERVLTQLPQSIKTNVSAIGSGSLSDKKKEKQEKKTRILTSTSIFNYTCRAYSCNADRERYALP
jgi:hypothetical protein